MPEMSWLFQNKKASNVSQEEKKLLFLKHIIKLCKAM